MNPSAVDDILNDLYSLISLFEEYKRCGGEYFQTPKNCFLNIVAEKTVRIRELSSLI